MSSSVMPAQNQSNVYFSKKPGARVHKNPFHRNETTSKHQNCWQSSMICVLYCVVLHRTCVVLHRICVVLHHICVLLHRFCVVLHRICVVLPYLCCIASYLCCIASYLSCIASYCTETIIRSGLKMYMNRHREVLCLGERTELLLQTVI